MRDFQPVSIAVCEMTQDAHEVAVGCIYLCLFFFIYVTASWRIKMNI